MSKKTKAVAILTPSLLSFSRCIEPTDGFFYQKNSQEVNGELQPVGVSSRKLRTTMSNRQKPALLKDREKMNAEIIKANIQETENSFLDADCDILVAKMGVKIIPFSGQPHSVNSMPFSEKLQSVVQEYIATHGFDELANRYANNIANARWLWRTRVVSRSIKVTVECVTDNETETLVFDAKSLSISNAASTDENVVKLANYIAAALKDEIFLSMYVTAEADVGYGHQVFPSEEMNIDEDKRGKKLFELDGVAGLHSVKIGNALRTIDTWYKDKLDTNVMPISVEPFGAVTSKGVAFRQAADDIDFYTLFDNWIEKDIVPSVENQHYVMAVMIRGGVFGKSSK